jgi:hypothetical protein
VRKTRPLNDFYGAKQTQNILRNVLAVLGEDRRSLLLDLASEGKGNPPAAREKP